MNLAVKTFDELTTRELYEILRVRSEVFVVEQTCIYQDIDEKDFDSVHIFYEEDGRILAYLRVFLMETEENVVRIGRVLTMERGTGLGMKLLLAGMEAVREKLHAAEIYIEAQSYAIGFYEKAGFRVTSEEFLEDGIPHVKMRVRL